MYATHVELEGNGFKLAGEFYEDGHGGLVGTAVINGVKHEIGLRGKSAGLYNNVNPEISTKEYYSSTSKELDVPLRSQWEIFYEGHGYDAASKACGEASAAMLEEYWTGHHPDIWDIWVWNNKKPMSFEDAERYLKSKGAYCWKETYYGVSLSGAINIVKTRINWEWPLILEERSQWGNLHVVVVKGYNDASEKFSLNDPNTWTGASILYWHHEDCAPFNFEDNVYKNVGYDDKWSDGIAYVN